MTEEKIPTGVKDLDLMLEGGVWKGINVLIKGGTGTGKTTLALQFLVQGARLGERGMYLSFEESSEQVVRYGSRFFPDLRSLIENGTIQIIDFSLHNKLKSKTIEFGGRKVGVPEKDELDSVSYIEDRIFDIRGQTITRVVLDGLQTFATTFYDLSGKQDTEELRRTISRIMVLLKKENITTYILSEEREDEPDKYGFISFVVDGMLVLRVNESLDVRTLKIAKMRGVKHTLKPVGFKLAEGEGIQVTDHTHLV